MNTKTMRFNNKISYYLSYGSEYEEIYESSYGTNFIFVDEEELEQDFEIDSIFPSGDMPGIS